MRGSLNVWLVLCGFFSTHRGSLGRDHLQQGYRLLKLGLQDWSRCPKVLDVGGIFLILVAIRARIITARLVHHALAIRLLLLRGNRMSLFKYLQKGIVDLLRDVHKDRLLPSLHDLELAGRGRDRVESAYLVLARASCTYASIGSIRGFPSPLPYLCLLFSGHVGSS